MSSGRDVMMENWAYQVDQAEKHIRQSQEQQYNQRMITRMIDYQQTLITELERIDRVIKELENECD